MMNLERRRGFIAIGGWGDIDSKVQCVTRGSDEGKWGRERGVVEYYAYSTLCWEM